MAQQDFEEPPELRDSEGNVIAQFRRPDGTIFSNHPEYQYAKAINEQQKIAADKEAEANATEIEDDVPEEEDNADGVTSYEEMTSHDLAALAKQRGIVDLPDRKRSTVIKALQEADAAEAAKEEATS